MTQHVDESHYDWNSRSPEVQEDQIAAYDSMRARCPVAHDEFMGYTLFKNEDVRYALEHPELFSNRVSTRHIAVPNGMDAPEHTAFRAINDKYFTPERMQAFEPQIREVVHQLVRDIPRGETVDIMGEFATRYAMRVQNAFMGWPESLEEALIAWMNKNRSATLKRDRAEIASVAVEFDGYIRALLDERRANPALQDVTAELLHDRVELPGQKPRVMTDEEIVSLIRNWTVGELSTVSAIVGVIVNFLGENQGEADRLRQHPEYIGHAVEEILRLQDPLVANRRITTADVEVGGRTIPAGCPVTINWTSANRDEGAFEDALDYRPDRDQSRNLTYGAGIHVCPGAPLARLELRVLVEELLAATESITVESTVNAQFPVAGYSSVKVVVR
ncbi:cytochrome P450 [Rothia sp. SD9660Na]|uniref:cytochrome P450 n=1 Tax=Rothia sp. SD9660Na TaxID=3047030 RepID=UPI0024BACBF1|nr:cytochrome P450 [Rothia sp. SD9660Na]WHS50307.1 cytochrome P450 [Rothia sp. SD9660Na]